MKTKAEVTLSELSDWYLLEEERGLMAFKRDNGAMANWYRGRANALISLIDDLFGAEAVRNIQMRMGVDGPDDRNVPKV